MYFKFIRCLLGGLVAGLFAIPVSSQTMPSQFSAVQFNGTPTLSAPSQINQTTCTATAIGQTTLPCTSVSGILPAMIVFDATPMHSLYIGPQAVVISVNNAASTVTIPSPGVTSTFANDNIQFIGQQINDQIGQSFQGVNLYSGNNWELSEGTAQVGAFFAGPMVKISKFESYPQSSFNGPPTECSAQVDADCNAALFIGVQSNSNDYMEAQGIMLNMVGSAPNDNCTGGPGPNGNCNIAGFSMWIRNAKASTGDTEQSPAGGLWKITDQGPVNSGQVAGLKGLEMDLDENSGAACGALDGMSFGQCNGLILVANGTVSPATVSAALHVRGVSPATFIDGLVFDQACCTNSDINVFDTTSANAILIGGAHSTAAINIATSAGPILLNQNYIYFEPYGTSGTGASITGDNVSVTLNAGSSSGTPQPTLVVNRNGVVLDNGVFITPAAQTVPQIVSQGDTSTGFYQSATGTWKYASIGTPVVQFSSSGLVLGGSDALYFSSAGAGAAYVGQAAADTASLYAGNGTSTQEVLRATYTGAIVENGGLQVGAATGGLEGAGTLNASGVYYSNGTAGVTCSGRPTTSFASTNGIVTHC